MSSPQKTTNDLGAVADALRSHDRFLLVTHENPDGDALGSLLGMHHLLGQLGKDSVMFMAAKEFPLPIEYRFLPLEEVFHEPPADVTDRTIVFLDCGNIDRMPVDFLTAGDNDVIVALTGVNNQQYVTVALSNVASADGGTGGSGAVRIGFLAGDVNQNRVVTVADLGLVNAQLAQTVTATNYLKDVNASGTLTVGDKGIANANLTKALPPP
jgi:hypothetical protein